MGSIQLQPRPLYGIGTVARLTGIKPDTLRIWERRYQLGASHKSASGRRQYTQADLEHLQLVAALVASGARIGEIASSERRTLEVMLRSRGDADAEIPEPKPRILFVGEKLCDWLEEHQGCLVNVDALLASCPLGRVEDALPDDMGELDGAVVACDGANATCLADLDKLAATIGTDRLLALYPGGFGRWQASLEERGYAVTDFPPDPGFLAFHLTRSAALKSAAAGTRNLGDLVQGRPRLFTDKELSSARVKGRAIQSAYPGDLTELVQTLAEMENSSTEWAIENWRDAAVHACIFAYASQARWLMEKALGLVVEAEQDEEAAA